MLNADHAGNSFKDGVLDYFLKRALIKAANTGSRHLDIDDSIFEIDKFDVAAVTGYMV